MDFEQRYEIERKLGQGGVGAVYEGYDHQLQRKVAIKRLLAEKGNEESLHEDLMRECHSLSALNSPNIVSLFDIGQDEDGSFVVMELLKGQTLEELVTRAPLTEEDFVSIAEQCLEGLLAAHDAHLLHRDLKPYNLMVTWLASGRLQIKLLDFGLAKFTLEPSIQTIAHGNSLFGSIYFMAPEQFEQKPLDARTDLYSLGSVFYYALTQEYPFNGDSITQVMAAHLQGHYKDLREYRPDLNPDLCNWVMSLMALSPDDRPESCEAALTQLIGVRQGTFQPPQPEGVEMITHPIEVQAAAMKPVLPTITTVQLQIPQTSDTTPVRTQIQPVLASATKQPIPKWFWPAAGGGMALLALIGWMLSGPDKNPNPVFQKTKDPVGNKASTTKLQAKKNESIVQSLRLPESLEELMKERDLNLDRILTRQEFIGDKRRHTSKSLNNAFVDLDLDRDGRLNLEELEKIYK